MTRRPDPDLRALFSEIPDPAVGAGASGAPLRPPEPNAAPARNLVRNRRLAALAGSGTWLLTHLAVYGIRTDFQALPALYVAAQILLPFLVASASLFAALSYGKLGLGLRIGLISGLAVLGPVAFCLIALGAPPPYSAGPSAASLLGILVCFDITVAWAALPLLCAAFALPGAFASGARWRSALVGAAVGLFAGASMNLHCPNVAPLHVLLGHGLPVIVATIVGALALGHRTRA